MLRQSLAFMAAVSLTASPILAQLSAAPLSVSRAAASSEGASELRGGPGFPPVCSP